MFHALVSAPRAEHAPQQQHVLQPAAQAVAVKRPLPVAIATAAEAIVATSKETAIVTVARVVTVVTAASSAAPPASFRGRKRSARDSEMPRVVCHPRVCSRRAAGHACGHGSFYAGYSHDWR